MATHSSILAWEMPWTEEPGGLQSTGSQRVRHDLETKQQRVNVGLHLIPQADGNDAPEVKTRLRLRAADAERGHPSDTRSTEPLCRQGSQSTRPFQDRLLPLLRLPVAGAKG